MPMDVAELLKEAAKLPEADRAALADSLLESLDTEIDEDAEEAWRAEIHRRSQEIDAGAVTLHAWHDAQHRLNGILRLTEKRK
jgi:putative addiction module component (TIGR02574 family)